MGVPHVRETKERNNGSGGRLQMGWTGWAELGRSVRFSFLPLFFCSGSLSIFCFPLFFISFANMLQNHSNHFQKFSKIQGIKVGQ
jgi:hypothetical protein